MSNAPNLDRRNSLAATANASLAMAIPIIIPATALGLDGITAPSERINLGVIGMGRRCKYVIAEMHKLRNVRCRAVADVQAGPSVPPLFATPATSPLFTTAWDMST